MRARFDRLTEHLRVCANCGRGTFLRTVSIDLYCSDCWSDLLLKSKTTSAHEYTFAVSSLLVWNNFSPQVENLIYSLKGGGLPSAFRKLAEHFAFELASPPPEDTMMVIPPSKRADRGDHARAWGEALSEVLSLELASPFEFATEAEANNVVSKSMVLNTLRPQKQLRVNERFERQFKLKNGLRLSERPIVFVDDLITSGATAQAAYKALNSPVDFNVWTIARRPKLAGI